jgi:hypothetical protein
MESGVVRPFDWRDLRLLQRLGPQGLCLDSQLAYSHGPHALQSALLGAFHPAGNVHTRVARPAHGEGLPAIGQIMQRNNDPLARLTFFSPAEAISEPGGASLLDALCHAAGGHGARNLIAEVDEHCLAFEALRRGGFAVYARQVLWYLPPQEDPRQVPRTGSGRAGHKGRDAMWRRETSADEPAIHFLYLNTVPALVQQIEPPPARGGRGLVHWGGGELLAYFDIEHGSLGVWTQPYFHPAAGNADGLLTGFLDRLANGRRRPVYVCVRSYQGWMNGPLESLGFETFQNQAVMVKRLAATVRRPALAVLPALEGTRPEPTAPFARAENHKPAPGTGNSP